MGHQSFRNVLNAHLAFLVSALRSLCTLTLAVPISLNVERFPQWNIYFSSSLTVHTICFSTDGGWIDMFTYVLLLNFHFTAVHCNNQNGVDHAVCTEDVSLQVLGDPEVLNSNDEKILRIVESNDIPKTLHVPETESVKVSAVAIGCIVQLSDI